MSEVGCIESTVDLLQAAEVLSALSRHGGGVSSDSRDQMGLSAAEWRTTVGGDDVACGILRPRRLSWPGMAAGGCVGGADSAVASQRPRDYLSHPADGENDVETADDCGGCGAESCGCSSGLFSRTRKQLGSADDGHRECRVGVGEASWSNPRHTVADLPREVEESSRQMLERDERQNTASDPCARQLIDQSNQRNTVMSSQMWEDMEDMSCQLREYSRQLEAEMAEMLKRTEERSQHIQEMRRENAAAIRNNETAMSQLYGLVEALSNKIGGLSRERSSSATATPPVSQEPVLELRRDLTAQKQQYDAAREEMRQQGAVVTETCKQMAHSMTKELRATIQECRDICQRSTTYTPQASCTASDAPASQDVLTDSSQRLYGPGPVANPCVSTRRDRFL